MEDSNMDSGQTTQEDSQVGSAAYKILSYPGNSIPAAYRNLVFSKWLRQLRFGNEYFKLIAPSAYYKMYHLYIEVLLQRPQVMVHFAVLADAPDVVLGWSAVEPSTLHFVYVHRDQRKQGIARSLVPFAPTTITHLTNTGMSIWTSKFPTAVFNPFFA